MTNIATRTWNVSDSTSESVVFRKDPDEELDYTLIWTTRLAVGETITTSEWHILPPPKVQGDLTWSGDQGGTAVKTANSTTIWLKDGKAGQTYRLHNRIVTSEDRHMDQTVSITIAER